MADAPDAAAVRERIDELAATAERHRDAFVPPESPPDEDRAMEYLREGAGPAVWLYVEARVDGFVQIDPDAFAALEAAMNTWFELYAACYGTEIDADVTVRKAAEALLDTHNIHDVARIVTGVPGREG